MYFLILIVIIERHNKTIYMYLFIHTMSVVCGILGGCCPRVTKYPSGNFSNYDCFNKLSQLIILFIHTGIRLILIGKEQ